MPRWEEWTEDILAVMDGAGSSRRDGFVASFDGPARAIRCAQAIYEATETLDVRLRVGLHTGECEVRDDDLGGLAVHIAARVAALAGPRDVLVSGTVKDLVVGSGIEFEEPAIENLNRLTIRA
jgi:class 3 adenylate cyclase